MGRVPVSKTIMELKRFYTDTLTQNLAVLEGEEFLHAAKVTRHKVGYQIIVCNGDGWDYHAKITEIGKNSLTAEIFKKEANTAEPKGRVVLMQAVCKELDFIVQKAVELGVTDIVPFYSARTNVQNVNGERLTRIATEAAKQCGRARVPVVHTPDYLNAAVKSTANIAKIGILCYENSRKKGILHTLKKDMQDVAVCVGSEGGFTAEEVGFLRENGFFEVSLGARILRAETAAISALTLVMSAIGEM